MTWEGVAEFAVVLAGIVAAVGLVVWRKVRLMQAESAVKQAELAVKQEAVRKGVSVADIQHLLKLPASDAPSDAEAVGGVARELSLSGASGPELEQAMALVLGVDSPTKQIVAQAIYRMGSSFTRAPDKEQLLAAVRGCCGAARMKANAEGGAPATIDEPGAAADQPADCRITP